MRQSFLKYLEYEKRYSPHTVVSYKNDLSQFETFIDANFPGSSSKDAPHNTLRAWIISLVAAKIEARSINRKIACLRSYYKFLLKRGHIAKDPTIKIKILKVAKKLPQFAHESDMVHLLDHAEFTDDLKGSRERLVLEMLYGTGIRRSELLSLRTADVNLVNNTIKVLGKRNKERVIPFSSGLANVITQYMAHKKKMGFTEETQELFVTDNGTKCYPVMINRIVKKYLSLFTTIEKRSPHVLRHTYATHLLNKGAELNAVKDLLGHTSLAATQVYTHNSLEKLKTVFEQAHPKA